MDDFVRSNDLDDGAGPDPVFEYVCGVDVLRVDEILCKCFGLGRGTRRHAIDPLSMSAHGIQCNSRFADRFKVFFNVFKTMFCRI